MDPERAEFSGPYFTLPNSIYRLPGSLHEILLERISSNKNAVAIGRAAGTTFQLKERKEKIRSQNRGHFLIQVQYVYPKAHR